MLFLGNDSGRFQENLLGVGPLLHDIPSWDPLFKCPKRKSFLWNGVIRFLLTFVAYINPEIQVGVAISFWFDR